MIFIAFLFVSVILASGVCSMTEAALLSIPTTRVRILHQQRKKNSRELLFIKEHITDTIATIVILNNAINIVGSIYIGNLITIAFGRQWLGVASTIITLSIIIISEIIPKTVGERYKTSISLAVSKPVNVLLIIFRPILFVLLKIAKPYVKRSKLPKVTEEEIKLMLKLARSEGTVEMDEEVLCNRVFKLNDVQAIKIMKPIHEIFAISANQTLSELKDIIINSRFSRIAVFDKDPLDIVGMVQHRALLREIAKDNYAARVKDFMVAPIFVNARTKADALLEKFQAFHSHLFIVQDDRRKDIGLVTMEDVLEELFGEIYDERDVDRMRAKRAKEKGI